MEMERDRRDRLDLRSNRNFWMRSIFGGFVLVIVFATQVIAVIGYINMHESHYTYAVTMGMVAQAYIVLKFLFPQIEGNTPEYEIVPIDEDLSV